MYAETVPPFDASAGYDPPARLRALPSWLSGQVGRRAAALVDAQLAAEGVRRQHFTVLTALAEQGPASQADVGRRLWIDRSDLHAILNDLERLGLISRATDPDDRRRNVVVLTDRGTTVLKQLDRRVNAAQEALLEPLSEADRSELLRLLTLLVAG